MTGAELVPASLSQNELLADQQRRAIIEVRAEIESIYRQENADFGLLCRVSMEKPVWFILLMTQSCDTISGEGLNPMVSSTSF